MIKPFIRSFIFHLVGLWLVAQNIGGIAYNNDPTILAFAAAALSLVEFFIKPILNFLLLPFNLITLGTFRWIVNVVMLYLTTLLVRDFSIVAFSFSGANLGGFVIPAMSFSTFVAYIVVSFAISVISSFLFWLTR